MLAYREFDVVELLVPVRDLDGSVFPAGTRASIADLDRDHAFVEVLSPDGTVYGPFDVALADLRLVEHARAA